MHLSLPCLGHVNHCTTVLWFLNYKFHFVMAFKKKKTSKHRSIKYSNDGQKQIIVPSW